MIKSLWSRFKGLPTRFKVAILLALFWMVVLFVVDFRTAVGLSVIFSTVYCIGMFIHYMVDFND